MKKNIIITLAKKEFFSFINSPLAYVITVPFLLISTFLYMRTSLVFGEASLRPFFELLPWYLILLAPALSMKLLTDEQQKNTIELLYAHPISEFQIVVAKFIGAFTFFLLILVTTLGLPLSLLVFSNPDPGIIISQYIGAAFVGATFLSIGLASSSYVKNAIGSFLLAAAISFALLLLGLDIVTLMFPWPFNLIATEAAVFTHMENIARGLLDIRDIVYFITITGIFLTVTIIKLSQRKTVEDKVEKRRLNIALLLIAGIGIALNVLMSFYPIKLDLTENKRFTLSKGTKQTLKELPDIVTITLFASRSLPAPMQLTLRETQDLLKDYQRLSQKVNVKTLHPDADRKTAQQAQSAGIKEVTFNQIGSSKFEVQTGFLGLSLRYGDKTESIPFIDDAGNLEYQLTRRIRKLTSDKQTKIGFFNHSFKSYQLLQQIIKNQYDLTNVNLTKEDEVTDISTLVVIDDGSKKNSTASAILKQYLNNGGKVLALVDGVNVNPQVLSGRKSQSDIRETFTDFGIKVNQDAVYDLQLNETLSFGQGNVRYLIPYPFFLKSLPKAKDFPPLSAIKSINLGWPSSVSLDQKEGIKSQKLLIGSKTAGRKENSFSFSPKALDSLPKPTAEEILLAASARKGDTRIVVVGDSDLASDEFLQNYNGNASFIANTIDWLAADEILASIPAKNTGRAVLTFTHPAQIIFYQYGNILVPPILVAAFAIFYLSRRRKLTKRVFKDYRGS